MVESQRSGRSMYVYVVTVGIRTPCRRQLRRAHLLGSCPLCPSPIPSQAIPCPLPFPCPFPSSLPHYRQRVLAPLIHPRLACARKASEVARLDNRGHCCDWLRPPIIPESPQCTGAPSPLAAQLHRKSPRRRFAALAQELPLLPIEIESHFQPPIRKP